MVRWEELQQFEQFGFQSVPQNVLGLLILEEVF